LSYLGHEHISAMKRQSDQAVGAIAERADLVVPEGATGTIIFAHGSGSSRFSPRNRYVAEQLNAAGFATLLFDLLTPEEAGDRRNVFDIGLLGQRTIETVDAVLNWPTVSHLPIGLFGASTGAAAALVAAAGRPNEIAAVVSRGGRPDLALAVLAEVRAPTLLIVGGFDEPVIEMNERALTELRCEKRLEIVPGATHLFEEPGTLERVVALAANWFTRYVKGTGR
jgi:pimeloyl-ACP methyl ester carboxylesterase